MYKHGRQQRLCRFPATLAATPPFSYPAFLDKNDNEYAKALSEGKPFRQIVSDHGKLYLRVVSVLPVRSDSLTVVTSEPLDQDLVGKIAAGLGEITLYAATVPDQPPGQANPGRRERLQRESEFLLQREGQERCSRYSKLRRAECH